MAIQNLKEAKRVLQAYGLQENGIKTRRQQLGQKARWMLESFLRAGHVDIRHTER